VTNLKMTEIRARLVPYTVSGLAAHKAAARMHRGAAMGRFAVVHAISKAAGWQSQQPDDRRVGIFRIDQVVNAGI
jgi:hypothetical protein